MNQPGDASHQDNPDEQLAHLLEQLANQPGISQRIIDEAAQQDRQLGDQLDAARKTLDLLQRVREHDSKNVRSTVVNLDTVEFDPDAEDIEAFHTAFATQVDQPALQSLGRFEIIRQLGEGGFGLVFLAFDPKLKRQVAIKIPRPQAIMTNELRRRFINEAEAAAALNHPNIIPVYDTGDIDSIAFIASQYCDGPTLEQWLQSNKQPTSKQAARLAITLAEATQHAHNRKVLHRDLKPQNILLDLAELSPEENVAEHFSSIARITDFGLAKVQSADQELTTTGSIIGTPAYIAPEVASGDSTGSSSADIYAIGAILYRVLAGTSPFKESTPIKTLRAVQEKEPTSIRAKNREVDHDLESICMKCLEKKPANRYENALELADDLHRYVNGISVNARPISAMQKLTRWCQRNPVVAGSMTVVSLTILTSLIVVTILWQTSERNRIDADQNKTIAQKETEQTRQAVFRLFTRVAEHPELKAYGMETVRKAILEEANQFYSDFLTDLPDDPKQLQEHVLTLYALAQVNFELGNLIEARKYIETGLDIIERRGNELESTPKLLAFFQSYLARLMRESGDTRQAIVYFQLSIKSLEQAIDNKNVQQETKVAYARMLGDFASQIVLSDVQQSKQLAEKAMQTWDELGCLPPHKTINDEPVAELYITQASIHELARKIGPMRQAATTAKDILEPLVQQHPNVPSFLDKLAESYRLLGLSYSLSGDTQNAMDNYLSAVNLYAQLSEIHADIPRFLSRSASVRYSVAFTQFRNADYESAEKTLKTNIDETTKCASRYPEMKAVFLQSRAFSLQLLYGVYSRKGDDEKKMEALQQACDQFAQLVELEPENINPKIGAGNSMVMLGRNKFEADDIEGAMSAYDAAIALLEHVLSKDNRITEARLHLSTAFLGKLRAFNWQQKWLQAIEYADKVAAFDDQQRHRMSVLTNSIEPLTQLNRFDEALASADEICQLKSGERESVIDAAKKMASAFQIIQNANEIETDQRTQTEKSYAEAAIKLLQRANELQAFDKANGELQKLMKMDEFQPLRKFPEFTAFINQLRN